MTSKADDPIGYVPGVSSFYDSKGVSEGELTLIQMVLTGKEWMHFDRRSNELQASLTSALCRVSEEDGDEEIPALLKSLKDAQIKADLWSRAHMQARTVANEYAERWLNDCGVEYVVGKLEEAVGADWNAKGGTA